MTAFPPDAWFLLALCGIGWAIVCGLASRPRWTGAPRWWPIRGFGGVLVFGVAASLALGGLLLLMTLVFGTELNAASVALLAAAWALALALTSRIGPPGPDPLRAQIAAGTAVIAVALGTYLAILWVVKSIGSPFAF